MAQEILNVSQLKVGVEDKEILHGVDFSLNKITGSLLSFEFAVFYNHFSFGNGHHRVSFYLESIMETVTDIIMKYIFG